MLRVLLLLSGLGLMAGAGAVILVPGLLGAPGSEAPPATPQGSLAEAAALLTGRGAPSPAAPGAAERAASEAQGAPAAPGAEGVKVRQGLPGGGGAVKVNRGLP